MAKAVKAFVVKESTSSAKGILVRKPEEPPASRPGNKAPASKGASPPGTPKPRAYKALAPERVATLLHLLNQRYPDVVCALTHESAWQLVVATILSAQCTDARVNIVTPVLFRRYPRPQDLAHADPAEVEEIIRTTGFFRNKTKSILGAAKAVVENFGGNVPETMDELLTLPGVARKTANVVLGSWFGKNEGVVVDTHVYRIARRLDLTTSDTPEKIEMDLQRVIPRDHWTAFSHEIIHHGRQICVARSPKCADCPLEPHCHAADKTWFTVWQHKALAPAAKELA